MDDQWSFTAKIKDVSIDGLNHFLNVSKDIDLETGRTDAIVKYHLEPEVRNWGIKSMNIFIDEVTCTIYWWVNVDELTPEEIQSLVAAGGIELRNGTVEGTFEVNSNGWKDWSILTEVAFRNDGGLMIDSLTIDLKEKVIGVS